MESFKTLILSSEKNNNLKAIVNLNSKGKSLIRFFNYFSKNRNLALGIKQDGKVEKIPLSLKEENSEFILPKEIKLDKNVICAVVDVTNAFCPELVLSGNLNTKNENENIENAFVTKKPDDVSSLYIQDSQAEIQKEIEKNFVDDMNSTYFDCCEKCKYRQAFYESGERCTNQAEEERQSIEKESFSNAQKIQAEKNDIQKEKAKNVVDLEENIGDDNINNKKFNDKSINYCNTNVYKMEGNNFDVKRFDGQKSFEDIEKDQGENKFEDATNFENDDLNKKEDFEDIDSFYNRIKPQIDALFEKYGREETLQSIVVHSKWVKINYDNDENYYVLGLIGDEDEKNVKFIAYGMPSMDSNNPPEDLKGLAQWLPTDFQNPTKTGYWIAYQNAQNGESINVDFV